MKYLCLAYGDEKDWRTLTKSGTRYMAAVRTDVITVRAWDGTAKITEGAVVDAKLPLAGFSVIEASDLNEVITLVSKTPCARAKGAIEIRPIASVA